MAISLILVSRQWFVNAKDRRQCGWARTRARRHAHERRVLHVRAVPCPVEDLVDT